MDPNEMAEMCANVRNTFIHLINITNIMVDGDIPSECFRLLEPMASVQSIAMMEYGGFGFLFEMFPMTNYVLVKGRVPLLNLTAVWELQSLQTLLFDEISLDAGATSLTVDDEFLGNYIDGSDSLKQIKVGDCGNKSYRKLLTEFAEDRLMFVSFIYKKVMVSCTNSFGDLGKRIGLKVSAASDIQNFDFKPLKAIQFKEIKVIGHIYVPYVSSRYDTEHRKLEYDLRYGGLWEFIFTSEKVTDVDLSNLVITDYKNKDIFDSLWFVYDSIRYLKRIKSVEESSLQYLRVTHNLSDAIDEYYAKLSIDVVKSALENMPNKFEAIYLYDYDINKTFGVTDVEALDGIDHTLRKIWKEKVWEGKIKPLVRLIPGSSNYSNTKQD